MGRYRLEVSVAPTRLAAGESALPTVRVLGVGNVRSIQAPRLPPVFGAEVAPAGDRAGVEVREGVAGGVRTFT